MTLSNNDPRNRDRQQAPPPRDELDELLREWHRQSAQHAAAVRDRLLGELVTKRRSAAQPFAPALDTSPFRVFWNYFATHRLPRIAASLIIVAGVAIVLLTPGWPFGKRGEASASDFTQLGFQPALSTFELLLAPDDQAAFRHAEQAVEEARADLADALNLGKRDESPPWIPWTKLYRNWAALGKWDEAFSVIQEFLHYAERLESQPDRYSMYYTVLSDLGNFYLAIADYDRAREYYERSLDRARDYQEWFHRPGHSPDPRPHALDLALATGLSPRFWMLSTLHATQGDTRRAWGYVNQAEEYLTAFFVKECAARKLDIAPDASLPELCQAVVEDGDEGLRSPVVMVREHLLYRTRLLRIDRDLDAAAATLQLAQTLPDNPFADGSRLDFNEPMERLRQAIARGDFAAALDAADEAGERLGPRHFDDEILSHPPIGLLARAELQFFRGLARAGLDPKDPEALTLIESAIKVVDQSATALPQDQRERFSNRFTEWQHVLNELRK